jgi:hypothetical protein
MMLHYRQNGFLLISGSNQAYMAEISLEQWLRNIAYSFWKLLDLGRVFIWAASLCLLYWQRKRLDETERLLLLMALVPLIIHIILFSGSMMPVSHRYFMLSQVFIVLVFLRAVTQYRLNVLRWAGTLVFIALLSGNLWFYPQRFGNAWDASLIFRSWSSVDAQLMQFLDDEGIEPASVMAEYPLTYRRTDMWLDDDTTAFAPYSPDDLKEGQLVLFTNFSNMYVALPDEESSSWESVWAAGQGRIEASLLRYRPSNEPF